jgi:hypothetical protein
MKEETAKMEEGGGPKKKRDRKDGTRDGRKEGRTK